MPRGGGGVVGWGVGGGVHSVLEGAPSHLRFLTVSNILNFPFFNGLTCPLRGQVLK